MRFFGLNVLPVNFLEQIALLIIYAGVVQGPFIAFLLNNRSVKKSRANIFLSVLLIALSFNIAHVLYAGNVFNHFSVKVYAFGDPTFLLIAPLLWFYTSELTGHRVSLSWKQVLHFLPFVSIVLFSLSFQWINSQHVITFLESHHRILNILFWLAVVIQFSCYQFFIHKKWAAYQVLIQGEVSNTENINISWVRFFMAVFLLVNLFFLFSLFAVIHLDSRDWLWDVTALVFSLSIFALGYKGILQREIFHHDLATAPMETGPEPVVLKPAQGNERQDKDLINKLIGHMEQKRPYLDPELTLSSLAKALELNRSQLSQLINEGIGDNFYDFVNKYRVEEVKRLMVDPKVKNLNLLGIALEAGFKSKSTFNLIFKRFTGLTPTEYKKNLSE
jgi:AraC-like DNA-binding protein